MKTLNQILRILMIIGTGSNANAAAPNIDTFNIQSYLKLSNNTPVSATSADFVFSVFKGATCIWAKRYSSVAINSGVLNQKISGTGTNIASISNASATPGECVANFSGINLNSTLLNTGSAAAMNIRIYTESSIDTYKPIWDIPLNSAPTAMISDLANTATTAASANDLAAGVKISISAGASDNGKFPVLSGAGQIDNSMIDQTALSISNTQVSGLGTAATLNTGNSSGNVPVLGAGGRLASSTLPQYGANKVLTTNGTGDIIASYDLNTGAVANAVPQLNGSGKLNTGMIDATSPIDPAYLTASVGVAKGGTGVATLATNSLVVGNGTGPVTTLAPGANGTILLSNGTAWTATTPNLSNIVDMSSVQASIGGNKTFTAAVTHSSTTTLTGATTAAAATFSGVVTHSSTTTLTGATTAAAVINANGGVKVGSTGTALAGIFKCSVTLPSGGAEVAALACTGATATSVVQCSPTAALTAGWSLSYARGSAANQIALRADQASGATGWVSATFNCVVTN